MAADPGAMTVTCVRCGATNPGRARFCADCGMTLESTQETTNRETRKLVTVLFADVAGSTALGERLDPETIRALMGRYFAVMRRIIEAHGGTVEKFIGDAVMAVFGIPVVHEDDALRAVRAAIDIRAALAELDTELGASAGVAIRFRTGINTGEVVAGESSSGGPMVTGDPVNTAARLEQAAAPGEILLGRVTWQLVRDAVTVEAVEPLSAKGKADPLPAYRLLALDRDVAGHVRRLHAPFVGRERELAALANAFDRVASERSCQLFTLLGTAGVGKSRLVAEFSAGVDGDATLLHGRCLSYGEGITYWPIGEIVRAVAGITDADSAEAARARLRGMLEGERDAEIVSERVASAIGLSVEVAPQEELFWAIRKSFEYLARDRPLVLVIDDIHWAEPTLLDLIEHIADWSRDAPILLLCPARPELLDNRAGWAGGKLNASNLLLEPLGAEATGRLIAALPGGNAIPAIVEGRVAAAAEGNPLYVEEFVGMLVDDGLLTQKDDGTWTAADALADVRIPASISALLGARLERLGSDERAVAERASVVGRVFEQAAVTELASETLRPNVNRSLLALVRKELVRPDRSVVGAGDAFRFRHILIRDAAYEALPKSERAALHERFADWLERTVGERLAEYEEIVGYHLEQAHRYRTELGQTGPLLTTLAERTGSHLASAAERASERGDLAASVALSTRASRHFPVGSAARLRLLIDLVFPRISVGDVVGAERQARDAADEARNAGESGLVIHAELEHALLRVLVSSERHAPRAIATAAIPRLEHDGDDLGLARANLVLASVAWMGGQVVDAIDARQRAMSHATRAADRSLTRRAVFWGAEFYGPMPALEAIARLEATLDEVDRNPLKRAQVLFSLAGLYAIRGRAEEARTAYRDVIALLDEVGTHLWAGMCSEIGSDVEMALGDPAQAALWLRQGIERLEGVGAAGYVTNLLSLEVIALARQGDWAAALATAERVEAMAQADDVLVHVTTAAGRATALLAMGDAPAAVRSAELALQLADGIDWTSLRADLWLTLAEALVGADRPKEARTAASEALTLATAKGDLMAGRRATALIADPRSG